MCVTAILAESSAEAEPVLYFTSSIAHDLPVRGDYFIDMYTTRLNSPYVQIHNTLFISNYRMDITNAEGAKEIETPITTAETADPSRFVAHIKVSS
jgi:hypothetical protein